MMVVEVHANITDFVSRLVQCKWSSASIHVMKLAFRHHHHRFFKLTSFAFGFLIANFALNQIARANSVA